MKPNEGLAGKVWQRTQPLHVPDYQAWSEHSSQFSNTPFHAVIGIPLMYNSRVLGVLGLAQLEPDKQFHDDDMELLSRFAELASITLANAQLYNRAHDELSERKRAEEGLARERNLLRTVIDFSPYEIFMKDHEGRYTLVNAKQAEVLGIATPAEALGKTAFDFFPQKLAAQFNDDDLAIIKTGQPIFDIERLGKYPNGEELWRLVSKVPLRGTDGNVTGVVGIGRDITEHKRAEEALKVAEQRYRALFEDAPAMYVITREVEGSPVIADCNELFSRTLGFSRDELLGQPVADFYSPASRIQLLEGGYQSALKGDFGTQERELLARDGHIVPTMVRAVSEIDPAGRVSGTRAMFVDITERKQAELELQQRKEDLELINTINAVVNRGESLDVLIDTLNNETKRIYSAIYCTVSLLSSDGKVLTIQRLTVPPTIMEKIEKLIDRPIPKMHVPIKEGGKIYNLLRNEKGTITSDPNLIQQWMTEYTESTFLSPALRKVTKKLVPQIYRMLNMGSTLAIPLISYGRTMGLLELASAGLFTEETLTRVRKVSEQVTTAILRKQAEEAELDQRTLAEALRETAEILSRSLDLGSVLDQILNIAGRVVPHDSATIMLIENGNLELARTRGYEERGPLLEKNMGKLNLYEPGNLKEIFESRQPVLIPDVSAYSHWKQLPGTEWLHSNVGAPLVIQDRVIGFLLLDSGTPGFFTPLHAQRLQAFADQSAIAVQNARLFESTRRQLEELSALHHIALAGIQAASVDELIERVTQTIGDTFFPDHFGVILLNENKNLLRPHTSYRGLPSADTFKTFPLTQGIAGKVASSGQPKRIGDIRLDPDYFQATSETLSELCVPIKLGERVIGVLNAESRQLDFFTEEDERLLVTIAGQTAIAIDNSNLLKRLQLSNIELERRVEERTAELNRINVELTHANRTKDEFLATISHELRTPLNSVLVGFSESLLEQRRGPLNEKQEQYVGLIHSSGQHLLSLINDILEVSKIEAGKLDLRPDIISVKEVCESSLNFVKEMAAKKSIAVKFTNGQSIPSLSADPRRLKQILVNLLNNAVKFTPEKGKVSLDVRLNPEKDQILFSVDDTGIGISHENLPKLFTPFTQLDSSLSRQYEGTGLGLVLVLKLTDLHGGSVKVESEPGSGSQFTVILPWNEYLIMNKIDEIDSTIEDDDTDLFPSTVGNHGTILLAEDNVANVLTIQEYLTDHGYQVIAAHNGNEAIAMAEENHPNLILMDIQMPHLDGLEAIRRLRPSPKFASVPIIALTALAMPGDRERCIEAGANEYLSKPVSLRGLLKTIHELLAQ